MLKRGLVVSALAWCHMTTAQEVVVPLPTNPVLEWATPAPVPAAKKTALSLPFFEDFTEYDLYPNETRWAPSRQVYVNNTMGINPVARGVATFDALGGNGRPYDTVSNIALRYADSLTSQPIDLSALSPSDSLYLSFYYQPQGAGFSPETQDSLMLYFQDSGSQWVKQWAVPGTTLQPFQQVMIPVRDVPYFHEAFQFRFVNKASINVNDDVWNVDYIRFAAGRAISDTARADVAFSAEPTPYLRDYTAMPYRQYAANAGGERSAQLTAFLYSGIPGTEPVEVGYDARLQSTGGPLGSAGPVAVSVNAFAQQPVSFSNYAATPAAGARDRVVFNTQYYLRRQTAPVPDANDTLVQRTVFDNYLAYDDGTAEKAYYLNLAPALPGKVAIEHRLAVADTLRGAAILFGQQVPTAANKFFTLQVYRTLAGVNGGTSDQLLGQQEFYQPRFIDSVNRFYVYTFDVPVALPAGSFYLGMMQPALSGSDSLYYALDVNRTGGNHLYYNVLNTWQSSTVTGALMARPILGARVSGSAVAITAGPETTWGLYPNPGTALVQLDGVPAGARCRFSDATGRVLLESEAAAIATGTLPPGLYIVDWAKGVRRGAPRRWIKL